LALLFVGVVIPAGHAADLTGKYVEYEVSVDSRFVSGGGSLRQEVVEDYGDGTALMRFEAAFGDTRFMVEKVVNSSTTQFPYLTAFPSFAFSTIVKNVNLSLTSEFLGTEAVNFKGDDWILSVTGFSLVAEPVNASVMFEASLEGTLKTFSSGLVYSVEVTGEADFEAAEGFMFSAQLTDTSLDPGEQVFSGSDTLSGLSGIFDIRSAVRETPRNNDKPSDGVPLSLILVGVAALAVSAVYLVRRSSEKEETSGESGDEKPSHWVH
jgi:hypothetical protein